METTGIITFAVSWIGMLRGQLDNWLATCFAFNSLVAALSVEVSLNYSFETKKKYVTIFCLVFLKVTVFRIWKRCKMTGWKRLYFSKSFLMKINSTFDLVLSVFRKFIYKKTSGYLKDLYF